MSRHERRAEGAKLRKAALASRAEIPERCARLRQRALEATDPSAHAREVVGRWVTTLSCHVMTAETIEFERELLLSGLAEAFGWTAEQLHEMTDRPGRIWVLCCSLEGRPRSSCDEDWENLGMIHLELGVPDGVAEPIIKATHPEAVHHFWWREDLN